MASLSTSERLRIAALTVDRARRTVGGRLLRSRLLRWRYGPPLAEQLLIVPQDLRTPDPSFAFEVEAGHFGLAGSVADLRGKSPFEIRPPSEAWARALHGFGWLRDLRHARGSEEATPGLARGLALDWIGRQHRPLGLAWETAVVADRLRAWITHAGPLLDGAGEAEYDRLAESLGDQLIYLSATWRDAPAGRPRLAALQALVLADLCIAGHDAQLARAQADFAAEIDRQIFADGGHLSRHPGMTVELLLDFLPLRQCYSALGRTPPPALVTAIRRMLAMVRFMQLGDGSIGRFNGMGRTRGDAVATVLAYDEAATTGTGEAARSGYVRLQCAGTLILVDAGRPPPLELAATAHAGCLSFELSSAGALLLANNGAAGPAESAAGAAARATASHNTLVVGDKSSSRLVRNGTLERRLGAAPLRHPRTVTCRLVDEPGLTELQASHDGYFDRFRLTHARRLTLAPDGRRLVGVDTLTSTDARARSLAYAVHFHLAPDVVCRPGSETGTVEIEVADGQRWRLTSLDAALSIEESVHHAIARGGRAMQIVLRGSCRERAEAKWLLERQGE